MAKINIKVWLDSGANSHSTFYDYFEIEEDEWNAMSEQEKDDYARDVAWQRMDWGWSTEC